MHFHADEVLLRRGSGHFQSGMAHAEADLEGTRRTATEYLIEIAQAIFKLQAEFRQAQIKTTLLAFGHAPGAHDKTLDRAVWALGSAFVCRFYYFAHQILSEPV